jgi:hypothetical protein
MKLQLTCKDVSRLLSDGQDKHLPPTERARMRLHLVICDHCREINEQIDFLRRAMRRLGSDEPPVSE